MTGAVPTQSPQRPSTILGLLVHLPLSITFASRLPLSSPSLVYFHLSSTFPFRRPSPFSPWPVFRLHQRSVVLSRSSHRTTPISLRFLLLFHLIPHVLARPFRWWRLFLPRPCRCPSAWCGLPTSVGDHPRRFSRRPPRTGTPLSRPFLCVRPALRNAKALFPARGVARTCPSR